MYKYIALCVLFTCVRSESVRVVTGQGEIVGQKQDGYNTFFGVPFAKVNESNPFGVNITFLLSFKLARLNN